MLEKLRKLKELMCRAKTANVSPWPVLMQERLLANEKASFAEKLEFDAFPRPHFAYGTFFAALQAKALGLNRISVYEFGVGWGGGLMELEKIAVMVEQETGILVDVYGFDTGEGMPESLDYRDLPNVWQPGFFHLDVDALEKKLTKAKLVLGNVKETMKDFIENEKPAPVGFVSFDVDYYSSTIDLLRIFDAREDFLLPRVYCYLDDIIGDDWEIHCEYVGELLAIKEFNEQHEKRKISKINAFRFKRKIYAPWNEQMFVMHAFDHSLYCKYINPKPEWEEYKFGVAQ